MTAGFGSLYYTDCLPGQGLTGRAGFQFQAATPGPAGDATHVVQRAALYEPPAVWMRERRPVVDYPRSHAHTAEEGFLVTAAGRYLGQEANGTRQGNQFTHAVVTRLPADYGAVRPAQLWGALRKELVATHRRKWSRAPALSPSARRWSATWKWALARRVRERPAASNSSSAKIRPQS